MHFLGLGTTLGVLGLVVAIVFAQIAVYYFFRQRLLLRDVLQHSIEAMTEGFVLYDPQDRLVMWNERARVTHSPGAQRAKPGTSFETILRREVQEGHFVEAIGQEEAWIAERVKRHRLAESSTEERLSNGRYITITKDRTPEGYLVSLIVDVTELKAAQLAAEAGDTAKSDMLRNISHELRTPLTVVLGHSSLLSHLESLPATTELRNRCAQDGAALETQFSTHLDLVVGQAQKIQASARHLLDLVNEILDLSRLAGGHLELHPEPIPIEAMVADVVAEFQPSAAEKGLALSYRTDDTTVYADRLRLKQILYNLVGNAVKFTDTGMISVIAAQTAAGTSLTISDTGCGIPEAEQDRIFDSFHQVDASDARSQAGSGLGLALTRSLVELHGGTIAVRSRPDQGSTFEVVLPASCSREAAPAKTLPLMKTGS